MIFQYCLEPVLIQRILNGFEAIMEYFIPHLDIFIKLQVAFMWSVLSLMQHQKVFLPNMNPKLENY